jgi:hypothetical protein
MVMPQQNIIQHVEVFSSSIVQVQQQQLGWDVCARKTLFSLLHLLQNDLGEPYAAVPARRSAVHHTLIPPQVTKSQTVQCICVITAWRTLKKLGSPKSARTASCDGGK